ncbi:MAG: DNA helicase, partial [Planctomycetia bacterium]|nr:DNA helicase [Planctomycetia bacterium]
SRPSLAEALLVAAADPCQTRTIRLARQADILVVHGPPGTGKSQTIANMIGDYLARGERVLLVCDKRVALDVVYYRLDRLGLGQLCAVVHDAQSDQRELYRSVRDQLDGLVEAKVSASAPGRLGTATRELATVHGELANSFRAVQQRPAPEVPSFHELMGDWLGLEPSEELVIPETPLAEVSLPDALGPEKDIREVLQRGLQANFRKNLWTPAAGIALNDYLGQSVSHWKNVLSGLQKSAGELDATADAAIPAFPAEGDVVAIAAARSAFGELLGKLWQTVEPSALQHWAQQEARTVDAVLTEFESQAVFLETFRQGPLDAELAAVQRESPVKAAQLTAWLGALDSYLEIASLWYGFLYFTRKKAAAEPLRHFGLPLSAANAHRVRTFLTGLRARNVLADWHDAALSPTPLETRHHDLRLQKALDDARAVLNVLRRLRTEPALQPLTAAVLDTLQQPTNRQALLHGLQRGPARAQAIAQCEAKLAETRLFHKDWLAATRQRIRAGQPLTPAVRSLAEHQPTLEGIVRIRETLRQLPAGVSSAVEALLAVGPDVEDGWNAYHRATLHAELTRRLQQNPALQTMDGEKLQSLLERYRELDEKKKALTRASILTHWVGKQKERLLAGTGSRLNGLGADLRRRLFLRGERAMRLRQVIKIGAEIEGGDPLFDMRPVWMAGPGTVAELFARQPLFDVVIFDEASQCRLEEALPVLTRGKRVVVAGDPQQLPPTRFFESALVQSEDEAEPDSDQALFESQQAEADDLLSAALNLSVEQSYLDVHYRSRHADLIEFSNRNFYESRLQAIPGHPANRPPHAPLKLHRVNGVYEQRTNPTEAARVVEIVRELLGREEPPSIGIACFNIAQRDLILDALDEAAANDEKFAESLATARERAGSGSFEGLFVRNLENVQGDERDCMIVSTTYGPDPQGRFYRRFGPLGRAGGGRRLNVLVTRARQEVHLVTSFPPESYRSLPPVPPGSVPTGGWLLFAYLNYAEQLQGLYQASGGRKPAVDSETAGSRPLLASVEERPVPSPSHFARALANELAKKQKLSSTVHWGNEGFCVDVALHDPDDPGDVALGILCDGPRYGKADDPVEWDVFRTAILEAQGWKLHRLWTPQFARDAENAEQAILTRLAGTQDDRGRDALRSK